MAVDVQAAYNGSYHSPGYNITLSGLTGYDSVTIDRIDELSEFPPTPVRGADRVPVSGGAFGVSDFEAPIGRFTAYRATAMSSYLMDTFSRTVPSGWGTPGLGLLWVTGGGFQSDYSLANDARISITQVNSSRRAFLAGQSLSDVDVSCDFRAPVAALGGNIEMAVMARYIDGSNYSFGELLFEPSGNLTLRIRRVVGGTFTILGTQALGVTHDVNAFYRVRLRVEGSTIRAKAWRVGTAEPTTWGITAADSILKTGSVGVRAGLNASNTNTLPATVIFDNFELRALGSGSALTEVMTISAGQIPYSYPGQTWLKSVGQPPLSRRVNLSEWTDTSRPTRILGEYDVLGKSRKVVITDVLGGREGSITLATFKQGGSWESDSSYRDLNDLLERGGTLLLQTTGVDDTGEEDMYFEIKGVSRTRVGVVGGDFAHLFKIDFIEVDPPATIQESLTLRDWQIVLNQKPTWQSVLNDHATWLSVLQNG